MQNKLLYSEELKKFFKEKKYNCIDSYPIINNNDTVFVTAGIQPLLKEYMLKKIDNAKKTYVAQPVIRTQYFNSIQEGSSIAFTNITTANFNHSEVEHNRMVNDWYELFYTLGIKRNSITTYSDVYETKWGELELLGNRTFHYYKDIEIGDTTFFTKMVDKNSKVVADSMSDLGFGLERLRWLIYGDSYYDLYNDSQKINSEIKAYLSVLALLAINNIKPTNKNSGYRARFFSKQLIDLLQARNLTSDEEKYLDECIQYWEEWQQQQNFQSKKMIIDEFIRNGNRYIINQLSNQGYNNLSGIDINISRHELKKRLINSGVDGEIVKRLIR